jgi:DNA-directed RNA polymerase subunit RPC12/RpoP
MFAPEALSGFLRDVETESESDEKIKYKKIKEQARFLMRYRNGVEDCIPGKVLYYCSKCRRISTRLHFRIKHADGFYEPPYDCEECGSTLIHIEVRENKDNLVFYRLPDKTEIDLECPECHGKKFVKGAVEILWD